MADRVGLWFFGARGSVAVTAICGLAAVRKGLYPATGCVTETLDLPECFPNWSQLVVGGHDVVDVPLVKRAELLAADGLLPNDAVRAVGDELEAVEKELRTGYQRGAQEQGTAADRIGGEIAEFRDRHRLDRVVVVNVTSTEPPVPDQPEHHDLTALERTLGEGRDVLPVTALGCYASLRAGCGYVEFTPSPGIRYPALAELALRQRVPYAGADAKTGQTLLRSVLAPMFAARALPVRSWSGTNLLGGGDGANLGDAERAAGKLASKGQVLESLLGADIPAPLHIDNVAELGERKVSWDYISFEGFLGARMNLQLSWDGYDSALAAPLVLDLARLVAGAQARGESGPLGALGFYFKEPVGSAELRLAQQAEQLRWWATS
ncbi:inositol-3-phosphate synthase [Sciscionella sediminilitoris]|uniref:inositol-3-phosphate synthase n=1 Tax=Sciscionella sediminilitoris TaxID=1445613 RepID=UPI0004DF79B1|nr:inositol-3-phosphate synthase [Sciscionella sp. SE31]